jgi:hypothetical protein
LCGTDAQQAPLRVTQPEHFELPELPEWSIREV